MGSNPTLGIMFPFVAKNHITKNIYSHISTIQHAHEELPVEAKQHESPMRVEVSHVGSEQDHMHIDKMCVSCAVS